MAKMLHRGKNKIAEPVPVYGFGLGPTKTKAKNPAMKMAHGFAIAAAADRAAKFKCPTREFSKIMGPRLVNDKTRELVTVKLQNNLYLSVVRRRFDIVVVCQ
jgi:hypothetical protein